MTARSLDTRLGRLEAARPASKGTPIDMSKLTEAQLAVCERIPWLPNGKPNFEAMTDDDLRVIVSLPGLES